MTALILTEGSPQWTIPAGGDVNVFGTAGVDALAFEEGASVTLDASFNAGNDTLYFEGDSTDFTVRNEGATVILTDGSGNEISLAAGTAGQTLVFGDGAVVLQIDTTEGTVNFGDQQLTETDTAVTATVDDTTTSDDQFGGGDEPQPEVPTFTIAADADAVDEGGTATFTVTLSEAQGTETTVDYAVTLEGGATAADHGDITVDGTVDNTGSGMLTFAAGETSKTITIPVNIDAEEETGEGVTVTLSEASTGTEVSSTDAATAMFTDLPAPTYALTIEDSTLVEEGQNLVFSVTPSSAVLQDTTLYIQLSGAQVGAIAAEAEANDFGASLIEVNFTAGDSEAKTIEVAVTDDGTTEGAEGFQADLLDSEFAAIEGGSLTGTINDNYSSGQTYTLTAASGDADGVDIITGTAGDDTFRGFTDDSYTADDLLDGGDGTDTLDVRYITENTDDEIEGNAVNIEVINVETRVTDTGINDDSLTFSMESSEGYEELWNDGSESQDDAAVDFDNPDNALIFDKVALGTTVGMRDTDLSTEFKFADADGDEDEATLMVDDVAKENSDEIATEVQINDIETINIMTTGDASEFDFNADDVDILNISGDQDLTINNALAAETVNAATFTGNLDVAINTSTDVTLTGGTGDDTVAMEDGLDSDDTLDGGDGEDTLSITGAPDASDFTNVSNFETLAISDSGNASVDNSEIGADFTTVEFSITDEDTASNNYNVTVTKLDDSDTVNVTSANMLDTEGDELTPAAAAADGPSGLTALGTVNLSLADDDGETDALTMRMENNQDDEDLLDNIADFVDVTGEFVVATARIDGVEMLTLDSTGSTAKNVITTLDASDATTVTITGDQTLEIGALTTDGAAAGDLITINASANTASVDLDIDGSFEHNVTGTAGDDNFTFDDGAFDNDDVVDGGEGKDDLEIGGVTSDIGAIQIDNIENVEYTMAGGNAVVDFRDAAELTELEIMTGNANNSATFEGLSDQVTVQVQGAVEANTAVALDGETASTLSLTIGDNGADGTDGNQLLDSNEGAGAVAGTAGVAGVGFGDTNGDAADLTLDTYTGVDITVEGAGGDGGNGTNTGADGADGADDASFVDNLNLGDVETATIDLQSSADFEVNTLSGEDLTSLTIEGGDADDTDADVTITASTDTEKLATVDGSSSAASIILGSATTALTFDNDATITLGDADDTLTFDVNDMADATVDGGNEEDNSETGDTLILVGNNTNNKIVVDLSKDDQITIIDGIVNNDVQTGFESVDASAITDNEVEITGNDDANTIVGSNSADGDTLKGGKGADTITGGLGADELTGGDGDDFFRFTTGDSNAIDDGPVADVLKDATGQDSIVDFAAGDLIGIYGELNTDGFVVSTDIVVGTAAGGAAGGVDDVKDFEATTYIADFNSSGTLGEGDEIAVKVTTDGTAAAFLNAAAAQAATYLDVIAVDTAGVTGGVNGDTIELKGDANASPDAIDFVSDTAADTLELRIAVQTTTDANKDTVANFDTTDGDSIAFTDLDNATLRGGGTAYQAADTGGAVDLDTNLGLLVDTGSNGGALTVTAAGTSLALSNANINAGDSFYYLTDDTNDSVLFLFDDANDNGTVDAGEVAAVVKLTGVVDATTVVADLFDNFV